MRTKAAAMIVTASPMASNGLAVVNIDAAEAIIADTIIINHRGSNIVYLTESKNLGRGARGLTLAPKCRLLLKRSLSSPIIPD